MELLVYSLISIITLFAFAKDSNSWTNVPSNKQPSVEQPSVEFKNTGENYREQLRKNRLQARIQRIQDLRKSILDDFEKSSLSTFHTLQQKILDLGDECLSIHEVFEEDKKLWKKIKNLGSKINTRCETQSEKLSDNNKAAGTTENFEKSRKLWKIIDELLDKLLGLIPQ